MSTDPSDQGSPRPNRRTAIGGIAAAAGALCLPGKPIAATVPIGPTKGFNIPGWLDTPDPAPPSVKMLERLAEVGFRTVRLPVDPELLRMSGTARRAGEVLQQLLFLGFDVIFDMHAGARLIAAFADEEGEAAGELSRAWESLSAVASDFTADSVYLELLNEPPMQPRTWAALRDRLAAIVRQRCPRHTLVWGPARYQGIWELDNAPLLADPNALVAVHYYRPMGFTHQCADWDTSPLQRIRNLPFPAARQDQPVRRLAAELGAAGDAEALGYLEGEFAESWTTAVIDADFATLRQWSNRNRVAVILNEFGVLGHCADAASRERWVRAVRTAAGRNGVGWTYWEFDTGFGFAADRNDPGSIDMGLVDALLVG